MSTDKDRLLPEMMGIEHEISVKFNPRTKIDFNEFSDDFSYFRKYSFSEEDLIKRVYNTTRFSDDILWGDDYNLVTKNGSMFKYISDFPLEIATPECGNPKELVAYRIAARHLIQKWSEELLFNQSEDLRSITIHDRVIDTDGNTWGEHDNFSLDEKNYEWGSSIGTTPQLLWLHLLTRGCVTGAGRISSDNSSWLLSQKLPTVSDIHGKKWGSTGYYSHFDRFEVRCSDKNVSEWSQLIRIGSFAIVMALAKTGTTIKDLGVSDEYIEESQIGLCDKLIVNKNGDVQFSDYAKKALRIQKNIAQLAVEYTSDKSVNTIYRRIASEWYDFSNKLEKQASNRDAIDLSQFIKTDWAAKFYLVQNRLNKELSDRLARNPFDYEAMMQDLTYDITFLDAPLANNKIYVSEGSGYKLNERLPERRMVQKKEVSEALENAPPGGRAEQRSRVLQQLLDKNADISNYHWKCIVWSDNQGIDNRITFN